MKPVAALYSRDDIASMLHADAAARKIHQWQLLNSAQIIAINNRLLISSVTSQPLFDNTQMFILNASKLQPLRQPHEPFQMHFPFADTILHAFPGKLIVAGGSVYKAFQGPNSYSTETLRKSDVDFFFIDCTDQEVKTIIRFAWELIEGDHDNTICVDCCQSTTTIYYTNDEFGDNLNALAEYGWQDSGGKLQFIHRIYPSAASVIGAFDLGPCMGYYDGYDFWATPLGAWSIATQSIILDVSRRSTSFEYRIAKYVSDYGCRLLIPNGSVIEAYNMLAADPVLQLRVGRCFSPIKGFRLLSLHFPTARYVGLDERLEVIADGRSESSSDENGDENLEHDDYNLEREREYLRRKCKVNSNHFMITGLSNKVSDYDGGHFSAYNLTQANLIFAVRGNVDAITWRHDDLDIALRKPNIVIADHGLVNNRSDDDIETATQISLTILRRWFSADELKDIITGPVENGVVPINTEAFLRIRDEIQARVKRNLELAEAKAALGITIIRDNPGRQWTASRNPVVSDVRDYYHPCMLAVRGPLIIGIPHKIYALLRLAQLKSDSVWRWLPKDVLKLILKEYWLLLAEDGNRKFQCL
ncbi:MAG: hypothetical protein H0X02_11925 [Nitrosomonas sp.]|nr:hypothetical protein [Nitrosomonas sp.]